MQIPTSILHARRRPHVPRLIASSHTRRSCSFTRLVYKHQINRFLPGPFNIRTYIFYAGTLSSFPHNTETPAATRNRRLLGALTRNTKNVTFSSFPTLREPALFAVSRLFLIKGGRFFLQYFALSSAFIRPWEQDHRWP